MQRSQGSSPAPDLPIWATLSLIAATTPAELAEEASQLGLRAEVTRDGRLQLPGGFLAWLEAETFPSNLADESAAQTEVPFGPMSLHVSGGTNELEFQAHNQPADLRRLMRQMRDGVSTMAGETPRILSNAGKKVEELTAILRVLHPLTASVVLPRANYISFSSAEFEAMAAAYEGHAHFPLYVFSKIRKVKTGAYAVSTGLFVFGLPEIAMLLWTSRPPLEFVRALGHIENEMISEGWWPEHGAKFSTDIGDVRLERVVDAVLAIPVEYSIPEETIRTVRHRFAIERCAIGSFGQGQLHRLVTEDGLAVDHHVLREGESVAVTNGLSLKAQPGGTAKDGNDYVEAAVFSERLGPWANEWLAWFAAVLNGHDGSKPVKPMDRLALPEPKEGIAGMIVWPMGYFSPYAKSSDDADATRVNLFGLVPILEEELALFREDPSAQQRWTEERRAKRDLEEIHGRWSRTA